jgi:MATE family multidrug resistance protein
MSAAANPERSTARELLDLALPMVVSQGSFAVMVFCDRLFLSLLGPEYMSAAMGGGVASFFSTSLFIGVMAYANALVAQYYGAGEFHKCPRVVTQGYIMALGCLPPIALIALAVYHLFGAIGHPPEQLALERVYYLILMLGCFFNLGKACIASYFSGIGRTRVVMIADVLGMLLNIPLSYTLIFGKLGMPELGIAGAAWGTVIATAFSLLVFGLFYFSRVHRNQFAVLAAFRFDRGIMGRYIRLGFPSGFELFMNVATFNLFILMFQSYGIAYGAAAAIVFNWDMVSFVPMIGLNIAVISLIGRYVGAGDMTRANGVIAAGFKLALGYSATLALLFVVFRVNLINVFAGSGADFSTILDIGSFMMVGLACYMMADASILISGGVLRGAGDTRWLMVTSISLHWLMLIAQYFIILVYDMDPRVSWVALVAMIIIIALVYLGRLVSGVWRAPERLARVMQE